VASKDDEFDDLALKVITMGVIMFIVMAVAVTYFSVINTVKIYNRLKDPEHPKHHLLKKIFGIPAGVIAVGLLLATSADPDVAGFGVTVVFWTIIGYFVGTAYLVMSPDALGPQAPSTALQLEKYLYPFELEPPNDRSVLPVQGYALTRSEKFEQAFRGLRVPPRGPEHDRAKLWEARISAFQRAMKSD